MTDKNYKGSSLQAIRLAIAASEAHGQGQPSQSQRLPSLRPFFHYFDLANLAHRQQKYSGYVIYTEGWTDVEHYSLCLYRLKVFNKVNHNGVFRNRSLSEQEIDIRLYAAMKRASLAKKGTTGLSNQRRSCAKGTR